MILNYSNPIRYNFVVNNINIACHHKNIQFTKNEINTLKILTNIFKMSNNKLWSSLKVTYYLNMYNTLTQNSRMAHGPHGTTPNYATAPLACLTL
jgi:hypothetical protein